MGSRRGMRSRKRRGRKVDEHLLRGEADQLGVSRVSSERLDALEQGGIAVVAEVVAGGDQGVALELFELEAFEGGALEGFLAGGGVPVEDIEQSDGRSGVARGVTKRSFEFRVSS